MDTKLRQLQLIELDILKEFVRICDKYTLRYYIVGGTLLGAVRHRGFIPWDDDIDVAMPREDYERFAAISQEELGQEYFYQSADTDPHYFLSYAKVRKKETFVFESRFQNVTFQQGVFIDIFPLDFCPVRGAVCHFLFNVLAVMNYRGQVDSGELYHPYTELIGKLGYLFLKQYSPQKLTVLRKRLIALSKRLSDGSLVASYSGAYGYQKEVFPQEWFGKSNKIMFECFSVAAPQKSDLLLRQLYGDYEQLPPLPQRASHVDIEKTKIENVELHKKERGRRKT